MRVESGAERGVPPVASATPEVGANGKAHEAARESELTLAMSIEEANLVLEGLGQLAFARVFGLVGKIQRQARAQLDGSSPLPAED